VILIIFVYCCKCDMFTFSRWWILSAEPLSYDR